MASYFKTPKEAFDWLTTNHFDKIRTALVQRGFTGMENFTPAVLSNWLLINYNEKKPILDWIGDVQVTTPDSQANTASGAKFSWATVASVVGGVLLGVGAALTNPQGTGNGTNYNPNPQPQPEDEILGMSKPTFYVLLGVIGIVIIILVVMLKSKSVQAV